MTFRHFGVITPGADRIFEYVNLFFYKLQAKYITEITASTALKWNYFLSNDPQEVVNSFRHAWDTIICYSWIQMIFEEKSVDKGGEKVRDVRAA